MLLEAMHSMSIVVINGSITIKPPTASILQSLKDVQCIQGYGKDMETALVVNYNSLLIV